MCRAWLLLACALVPPAASAHDIGGKPTAATLQARTLEAPLGSEPPGSPAQPVLYSFMARKLTWGPGQLAVCFWNGPDGLRQQVADIADELTRGLTVSFVWKANGAFVTCPAVGYGQYVVRVSLAADPSLLVPEDDASQFFATIGRAARVDVRKATVNMPFPDRPPVDLLRSKTLHEFCHALGCLHEHQRIDCGFDKVTIEANMLIDDATYQTNYAQIPSTDAYYQPAMVGSLDKDSIMLYTFYRWMFLHPDTSPCFRDHDVTQLSPRDKVGLAAAYQTAALPIPTRVADFNAYAGTYAAQAVASRNEAATLRSNTFAWAGQIGALGFVDRSALQQNILGRAAAAELNAVAADRAAAAYRLQRDTLAKLNEAMRLLPPD